MTMEEVNHIFTSGKRLINVVYKRILQLPIVVDISDRDNGILIGSFPRG